MSDKEELAKAIQDLREEIETLDESDSETRTRLTQLADFMNAQLMGSPVTEDLSTADTFKDLIETCEVKYPRVTAMANDLMMRLAAMGI